LWPIGFITAVLLSMNVPRGVAALLVVVESLAWLLYTVLMHAKYGQTVGKMVSKVRVVDYRTKGNISFLQACLREGIPAVLSFGLLGYEVVAILAGRLSPEAIASGQLDLDKAFWLVTALPGLWFLAEVLTMLTNDERRALHDFIAGTVVVRSNMEEGAQPSAQEPVREPTDCLECGDTIPADSAVCPKCGWSYGATKLP
jgi:uncharacterized RDD family membrane protein YckC